MKCGILNLKGVAVVAHKDITKYVGKQIRKYRLMNGMTQKELGLRVGVKHNTISSYESGVNEPEQNMIFTLANALGISVDDLFPPTRTATSSSVLYKIPVGPLAKIPIVGVVKCGPNGLAFEEFLGHELTEESDINGGNYFYLQVSGNSMTGEGIFEGDLALVREQPEVESGELAVTIVNEEEGMLKRVFRTDNSIVLRSANPAYPPLTFVGPDMAQVHIVGKVKALKRKF